MLETAPLVLTPSEAEEAEETDDLLLTARDVARILRVSPRTVARWTQTGALACLLTPSGHRRYRDADVRRLLDPEPFPQV